MKTIGKNRRTDVKLLDCQNIDDYIELALKFLKPIEISLARQQEMLITKQSIILRWNDFADT